MVPFAQIKAIDLALTGVSLFCSQMGIPELTDSIVISSTASSNEVEQAVGGVHGGCFIARGGRVLFTGVVDEVVEAAEGEGGDGVF